jgi:radical SAM superfamily enzyme YgiQ (UPF0313 family)
MLDIMNKKTTVEQNRAAVVMTRDANLKSTPQFVVGHPGETRETLKETLQFAQSIDFWDTIAFHYANAYPGSAIYRDAMEKGLITDELAYVEKLAGTNQYLLPLGEIPPNELKKLVEWFIAKRTIKKLYENNHIILATVILLHKIMRKLLRNLKERVYSYLPGSASAKTTC